MVRAAARAAAMMVAAAQVGVGESYGSEDGGVAMAMMAATLTVAAARLAVARTAA